MMPGRLLLRFDDICPTMNWEIWQEIEQLLSEARIKPLMAVIPDNRDPTFYLSPPRPDFWDRVRLWQSRGWTVGVHGYQHTYVTHCSGLMGINRASEFAGLPFREQQRKIRLAMEIFRREGLTPNIWVAPSHSFDKTTLLVLRDVGLSVVSDGFGVLPYEDGNGMFWVPQQMWRLRVVPFGVWTVCMHHNFWGHAALARFRTQLRRYQCRISSFDEVIGKYRGRRPNAMDAASSLSIRRLLVLKRAVAGTR
jgi:predicted deacetylase